MKILIAGAYGEFCELLINRLKREKHDIYIISDQESGDMPKSLINYNLKLTDQKLRFVIYSIMPEVIIFLGALDENYDFMSEQKASMEFLAGLSNLLIVSSSLNITRFIYLSTIMVYGTKYQSTLTENMEKKPEEIRSLVIDEGESLCLKFHELSEMKQVILRFSEIYGLLSDKANDFCNQLFTRATNELDNPDLRPLIEKHFSLIYSSDAVDAVYKAVTIEKAENGIFNVSASNTKLSDVYKKIKGLTGLAIRDLKDFPNTQNPPLDFTVDFTLFSETYGYRPLVDIDTGLTRMYRARLKQDKINRKKIIPKKEKSGLLKVMAPFFENIFIFVIMAALSILTQSNDILTNFNFMNLYIIIIAITFGLSQASLSIILSGCFVMLKAARAGTNAFDILINLDTIVTILELLIVAVICGHTKDNMTSLLKEKKRILKDNQEELETIYKINDANIKIKQTLDHRLINYEDSLAKIYSIVDKLNSLQPDAIFFSSIDVIMQIMHSNDVSIYIITGGDYKMCRLMAKTPLSIREYKKSVPLIELGKLAECLERNEIFVNRDLEEDLPMMAAPIFSNNTLVSIIMLWSVEFEDLTIYNTNRFFVISQLISSIIERAYIYTQSMNESMYLSGTNILTTKSFEDILNVYQEAAKNQTSTYQAALISCKDPATGLALKFEELALRVRPLLRTTDYLGQCNEKNMLYILLTNTNTEDFKFVYDRLTKAAITVKEVDL